MGNFIEIENFFTNYRRVEAFADYRKFGVETFVRFKDDFEKLKNEYLKIKETNKSLAYDFNIFQLMDITRLEVKTHSAMLQNLLDSNGTHGQGNLFFKEFLSILAGEEIIKESEINRYSNDYYFCEAEKSGEAGRVDIMLWRLDGDFQFCFIIENKIGAGDQENQIGRYWQDIEKLDAAVKKKIFYLTPDGGQPTDMAISKEKMEYLGENGILYCLSYEKDIEAWLENAIKKVESKKVEHTIRQYIDILKTL